MLRIVKRSTKLVKETYTVEDDPTAGTYGDYLLLKELLRSLDEDVVNFGNGFISNKRFKQLMFNTEFLENMLKKHGELHCEYCGKPGLVIYHWTQKFRDRKKMATTDHILPVSEYPHLAYNVGNCAVSCDACNRRKGTKLWDRKFPYKT